MMIPGYLSAQSNAGATASATIMTDPGAVIAEDMNWGGKKDIELTVTASVQSNPHFTGNYKLLAVYNISNFAYSVTLPPATVILKRKEGLETISAKLFIDTKCDHPRDINVQALQIGALFNMVADTPPGHYSTTLPYLITVNYN